MAVLIGRVSEHDLSNITVGGKVIFVPPEKRNTAWVNFPAGSVAKVTVDKGTATSIVPPSEAELAAFTRDEMGGKPSTGTTTPAAKTAQTTSPAQTPPSPPPAQPKPDKEAHHEVAVPIRQASGNKEGERICWQALLNTSVNIIDPSWRDDPNKTIQENVSARLELVKATASGLHVFITEKLKGGE